MRGQTAKSVLFLLGSVVILGLLALVWALGPRSSEAQQGVMHGCPQAGKWAIAVWSGDDGTDTGQALATCGVEAVASAYYLDPNTCQWLRWFPGHPELNNLATLDNMQGIVAYGSGAASPPSGPGPIVAPAEDGTMHNCPQPGLWAISAWEGSDGTDTGQALHTCGAGAVAAAYYLDPDTQAWLRWFREHPEWSDLATLDNMQGVIALGGSLPEEFCGPVLPTTYTGTVTVDGQPAPDGTVISAIGSDGVTWATTTTSGGSYAMDVPYAMPVTPACFPSGTISFMCDGVAAAETCEATGGLKDLNLSCGAQPTMCGDVNCDGVTDIVDALFVLQYDLGLKDWANDCPPPLGTLYGPAGDVNCDGDVDIVDALFILQYDLGLRPELCVCGITPTEIIIGTHFAQTGTCAARCAPILTGLKAYFEYVNEEEGGVCGREIVFKVEDDQCDPARAVEAVKKLLEQDKVFAIVAGLGTATHSAVWESLNQKGVPDLWIMSGAHKWGADPENYPWSVAMLTDYFVEGTIVGKYISENLPGKKVAILYENSDFGWDGLAGLKNGLDPDKNELVCEQSYEVNPVSVRSQVENMKNAGAEVVVLYSVPSVTAQAVKEADRLGWHPQWFMSYVNADPIMFQYSSPDLMEGAITFESYKLSDWTDDPAVAEHHRIISEYGDCAPSNYTMVGQSAATLTVEALRRTCDNLTREGLMDAVHSFDAYQLELTLPGITISLSPTDHLAIEAMRALRATIDENGNGKWEYFGDIIPFRD